MDANIKIPQDALEWLDRSIREEAELDGEMSNTHAIQIGFIQNMMDKFPRRNCDRFASADEAIGAYRQTHKYMVVNVFLDWLFAPTTEKEGGAK